MGPQVWGPSIERIEKRLLMQGSPGHAGAAHGPGPNPGPASTASGYGYSRMAAEDGRTDPSVLRAAHQLVMQQQQPPFYGGQYMNQQK